MAASAPADTSGSFSVDGDIVKMFMPHRGAMALLDGVKECSLAEARLLGFKNVARNDPVLAGHFPDDPVFPPSLIIEALAQAAGCLMNLQYVAERGVNIKRLLDKTFAENVEPPPLTVLAESRVTQTGLVRPGDQLLLSVRVKLRRGDIAVFSVEGSTDNGSIANGEVILARPPYVPGKSASSSAGAD